MADQPRAQNVTALLQDWRRGDQTALDRLIPLVYDELRRVARARLKAEPAGHTLRATALVHEAYLRLTDVDRMTWQNRTHFFAVAARLMRQVLVDHARRKRAAKRGGGATLVGFDDASVASGGSAVDALALDEALNALSTLDPRLCRVVELKFFAGLNIEETAEALGLSPVTIERDWATAKAWLYQRLSARPI